MLGKRIKDYILNRGYKIGSVAHKCHIPFNTFSAMLNGNRTIKAEEYFSICRALDVPLNYFVV
ncbi:MAG: helix-turn-helix transcriptional regulator [Clostridia bacterium]|nr:helix-turn-helix transcriptional regulator [Clostridia bacterium]